MASNDLVHIEYQCYAHANGDAVAVFTRHNVRWGLGRRHWFMHSGTVSLEQILKAATISNARAFQLDSQVGTIEKGKLANLVLLRRSPLESVDAYDSIVTVWVHGRPIARSGLSARGA